MAINTINEKLALIEYGDIFQPGIPISSDGIDQLDKQQLLWEYCGWLCGWLTATAKYYFTIKKGKPKFKEIGNKPTETEKEQ